MANCELLFVGTELLLGDILNTNAQFLSKQLAGLGFALFRQSVVGDNAERIRSDFLRAWERTDFVILTGGLGPTADDITRETVCEALDFKLEQRKELLEPMRSFFSARGCEMPESNLRQAMLPVGAIEFLAEAPVKSQNRKTIASYYFQNPHGTAPGIALIKDGKCAILLPGPPFEMEAMFRESVYSFLSPWANSTVISHELRTMGIGESAMAELVSDLLDGENPSVAPYAKTGEALLRVTAKAQNREAAESLIAPVLEKLKQRLEKYIYGVDVPNIECVLLEKLCALGKTVATAESITGGSMAKRLTDCAGSSQVFKGSVVAYCDETKKELLGISDKLLNEHTAVSETCAAEMAKRVKEKLGVDFALASTGFADGDNELHAYLALAGAEENIQVRHVNFAQDSRKTNRLTAENTAFQMLWEALKNQQLTNSY